MLNTHKITSNLDKPHEHQEIIHYKVIQISRDRRNVKPLLNYRWGWPDLIRLGINPIFLPTFLPIQEYDRQVITTKHSPRGQTETTLFTLPVYHLLTMYGRAIWGNYFVHQNIGNLNVHNGLAKSIQTIGFYRVDRYYRVSNTVAQQRGPSQRTQDTYIFNAPTDQGSSLIQC